MSIIADLNWPRLLDTPTTRWYLDRGPWGTGQRGWQDDCDDVVVAYVEFEVCGLPGDAPRAARRRCEDLVCTAHLPAFIAYATNCPGGNPLVANTVVEVGVDPALLRLTGVDPVIVDRFNDGAMGVTA